MSPALDLDATFLPAGQMRQLTSVASFAEDGIVCGMSIESHWTYPVHFPDDPILPGSLIIEAAGQATALWAWLSGQRGKPRMVKTAAEFRSPAGPRDGTLTLHATIKRRRNLNFGKVSVRVGDQEIATVANCIAVI
jgi:3-hydroxymyristoyl/3-hydroxydecanoyl-(acyl carrier protein) dehydratase